MTTVTISFEAPAELARRLAPLQDRLPEIIELGLRQWRDVEPSPLTPRQRVEQIWAGAGLIVSLDPALAQRSPTSWVRQPPVRAGGKPASEIIIEQRGSL